MKICIITVFDVENCGSFLQAFALQEFFTQQGHQVYFLKRNRHKGESYFLDIVKRILRFRLKDIKLLHERHSAFCQLKKKFRVLQHTALSNREVDLFVIGSDTVWNIESPGFRGNLDFYTGKVIKDTPYIFYAASSANVTIDMVNAYGCDFSSVKSAKGVSVRDHYSQDLILSLEGVKAELVLDPTLLVSTDSYKCFEMNTHIRDEYLLIYHFGTISEDMKKAILCFSKENNLRIINFGAYYPWCDVCVQEAPNMFITYFMHASYVITNTFHGTVFSTIFHKQFVTITSKKNKVLDYLQTIKLPDRITEIPDAISAVLLNPINYDSVERVLDQKRLDSVSFLKQNLF